MSLGKVFALIAMVGLACTRSAAGNFNASEDPCKGVGGQRLANVTRTAPSCFGSCPRVCTPMVSILVLKEKNGSTQEIVTAVCIAKRLFRCMYDPMNAKACSEFLANASRFGLPPNVTGLDRQCANVANTTTTMMATTTTRNATLSTSAAVSTTSTSTTTGTTTLARDIPTTSTTTIAATTTAAPSFSCRRSRRASTWKVAAGAAALASMSRLAA